MDEDSSIWKMLVWMAAACFAGALIGAAESQQREGRTAAQSAALFAMEAEKFLTMQESSRPVDPTKVDQVLLAAALFHETNLRRTQAGKRRLAHDARLDAAANMQAESMAKMNYVSHTNPYDKKRRTPMDRARRAEFRAGYLAENVASTFAIQYQAGKKAFPVQKQNGTLFSYEPGGKPIPRHTYRTLADSLLDQWMASPGHRRNILAEEPALFGSSCAARPEKSGIDQLFCVQLFGSTLD